MKEAGGARESQPQGNVLQGEASQRMDDESASRGRAEPSAERRRQESLTYTHSTRRRVASAKKYISLTYTFPTGSRSLPLSCSLSFSSHTLSCSLAPGVRGIIQSASTLSRPPPTLTAGPPIVVPYSAPPIPLLLHRAQIDQGRQHLFISSYPFPFFSFLLFGVGTSGSRSSADGVGATAAGGRFTGRYRYDRMLARGPSGCIALLVPPRWPGTARSI